VDGVLWHHCRFCEHAAKQKGNIKTHEATHLGDRPFQCQYCDDTFTAKTTLVNHERTHTGERPYGCGECGARFNRRFSLIIHEWTHAGIKPYLCSACDYAAVQSCSVTRHIKARHPGSGAMYINATGALGGPDNEHAVVSTAPAAVTTAGDTTLPVLDAAVSRVRVSLPAATAPQAEAPPPIPDIDIMDPELFVRGSLLRLLHATPEQQAVLLATEEYRHVREAREDTRFKF
jgi:transcription elongation factor Elf1